MPLIKHEFVGDICSELLEASQKKTALNSLMLGAIQQAARLRRKEKGRFRDFWDSSKVISPDVRSEQDSLEPNQEISAWLEGNTMLDEAELYTRIIDKELNTPVTQPQKRVTAEKRRGITYPFDDGILTPESQLELVEQAIETVGFISMTIELRL